MSKERNTFLKLLLLLLLDAFAAVPKIPVSNALQLVVAQIYIVENINLGHHPATDGQFGFVLTQRVGINCIELFPNNGCKKIQI